MRRFKDYAEYQAYNKKNNAKRYAKIKADPIKWEVYKAKRRAYEKKHNKDLLEQLKGQG